MISVRKSPPRLRPWRSAPPVFPKIRQRSDEKMSPQLPAPAPQIPVRDLARAVEYYRSRMGFSLDWQHEDGIAGVSRDGTRLFLDRVAEGPIHPVRVWLDLDSVAEVDALHREWQQAGATISSAPAQKPWGLYEFTTEDVDGNSYRVFYDTQTPPCPKAP